MSLVIVISENAIASMHATGNVPADLVGNEIYVHDTREIYWESGENINPGMHVSAEDRLDQAYYTAMAQMAAEQMAIQATEAAATPSGSQNLRICWK